MKKTWRALWARRPRLGRGGRTVRNLLLTAALVLMIWGQYGCPLPTAAMEFRRLEGQYLLPRSEIVYQSRIWRSGVHEVETRQGTLSMFAPLVVGVSKDQVRAAAVYGPRSLLEVFPLEAGITPVPVRGTLVDDPGDMWVWSVLFLNVPEGAVRGELDLEGGRARREEERAFVQRKAAGYDLGDGIWLFPMDTPEESFPRDWYTGASYTLRLYGGDGALLLEREGVLPEPV